MTTWASDSLIQISGPPTILSKPNVRPGCDDGSVSKVGQKNVFDRENIGGTRHEKCALMGIREMLHVEKKGLKCSPIYSWQQQLFENETFMLL